jgi:hypothetical protein
MKKSKIAWIVGSAVTVLGFLSWIAVEQSNQTRIEMERLRMASQQVEVKAEAERQRSEQLKQEAEAKLAEEKANQEERDRLEVERQRLEQERLAALQREKEELTARTAAAWNQFAEAMTAARTYTSNNSDDPQAVLRNVNSSLESISLNQVDPKVAGLISDIRDTTRQIYELVVDLQARKNQVNEKAFEDAKVGCEAANMMTEENKVGWCLFAGAMSGAASQASGEEELNKVGSEYGDQIMKHIGTLNTAYDELEAIRSYLQETYGIDAVGITKWWITS